MLIRDLWSHTEFNWRSFHDLGVGEMTENPFSQRVENYLSSRYLGKVRFTYDLTILITYGLTDGR